MPAPLGLNIATSPPLSDAGARGSIATKWSFFAALVISTVKHVGTWGTWAEEGPAPDWDAEFSFGAADDEPGEPEPKLDDSVTTLEMRTLLGGFECVDGVVA